MEQIHAEDLLAHDAWLRRMVQDLVEQDLVEDVVQETFLAAWLHGRVRNLPGFLYRVGRNLALRQRRGEGRRRHRERAAAKGEALPATSQMLQRLEAHRQLTAAVSELQEPHRTTVLLRYFEGLSPREIAARQGVPASTVRTRLERGIGQLRRRLEGTDLRALGALFLWPEATTSTPTPPAAAKLFATLFAGAVFMSVHLKSSILLGLLVLLAGAGVWYWDPLRVETGGEEGDQHTRLVAEGQEAEVSPGERAPLELAGAQDPQDGPVLRGRVLDTRGVAVANVQLLIDRRDPAATEYDELLRLKRQQNPVLLARARTDQEGRFEVPAAELTPEVEVDARLGDGFVPLWLWVPPRRDWDRKEVLVVAAPPTSLAGQVVDEHGVPVGGAIVLAIVPGLFGFPFSLEDAQAMPLPRTATNAQGQFSLAELPDIPELELWVLATGFRRATVARDQDPRAIVLEREGGADRYRVQGTVVDRRLRVVEGALVKVGSKETHTDARGRFDLAFQALNENSHLVLAKKGHCTTTWDQHLEPLRDGRHKEVVAILTLGDTPRRIAGRVVDEAGQPVVGLVVVLKDVLFLDFYQTGEDLALGRKSRLESASGNPMKVDARTNGDGGFEVLGLAPRSYRLHVFDPQTLVAVLTDPIAAGTGDVVVQFPRSAILPELRGSVRSSAGQPLADVEVKCALRTFHSNTIQVWAPGDITRTGADGGFVLKRVPRQGVHLKVSGGEIIDHDVAVEDAMRDGEVVLVPPLRCRFRIRGGLEDADAIRLLDGEGGVVTIFKKAGQMSMSGKEWSLRRGRTTTLAASETARTLVYLKGGKELARKAIRLDPGRVNDLH